MHHDHRANKEISSIVLFLIDKLFHKLAHRAASGINVARLSCVTVVCSVRRTYDASTSIMGGGPLARDLTDAFIRNLKVEKRTFISDSRTSGLVLRAFLSGTKTWAVKVRSPRGGVQEAVIGSYPDMKLSEAREVAGDLRRRVKSGEDITASAKKAAAAEEAEAAKDIPTLWEILEEYGAIMSPKRRTWQKTKTGRPSEAYHRIEAVFGTHLQTKVTEITLVDLARSMTTYKPESGKATANGQVSRARAYLMPVLDWCAHRHRFDKLGLGRDVKLDVVDLRQTHDPASDDHSIKGSRDRALNDVELGAILPLLKWPAPSVLRMKADPSLDLRPIALRFLFLTCARREELVQMRWEDFRENSNTWHKPYVKTISGPPRQQSLPLSDAAANLLRSLPTYATRNPKSLVFPNVTAGPLGNWDRITAAIQRESGTSGWHRHDLRRTGATIMKILGIAPRTIDEILAHNASKEDEGTSRALENYFSSQNLLTYVEDPQKSALDRLAAALDHIERTAFKSAGAP